MSNRLAVLAQHGLLPFAYGGIYISVALVWLWALDAGRPTVTDWTGVGLCLLGMSVIMLGARPA